MNAGTPPAEFEVTVELVRELLRSQHSDLAALSVEPLAHGWDNALYRLGPQMIVRLPRRQLGADFIEKEQYWLPRLAPHLPLPIPAPVRTGRPEAAYPWPWSITPFFAGEILGVSGLSQTQTQTMTGFLLELHQMDDAGAPVNEYRGGPLTEKDEQVQSRIESLSRLDLPWTQIRSAWTRAKNDPFPGRLGWIHGDLHSRNLLVNHGALTAVLDWGDVCLGDPATDLALFFNADLPQAGFEPYRADSATILRSAGWAIHFALMYLEAGEQGDEVFRSTGRRMLLNVIRALS